MDLAISADHVVKLKESEKRTKYLDLDGELKKLWNMKETVIAIVFGALGMIPKELVKGMEDLEIRGQKRDHPDNSITKITQNTEQIGL